MNTIPSFPGPIGDYTDQAPELGTPPFPAAYATRVRKPNRRPGSITQAVTTFAAAFFLAACVTVLALAAGGPAQASAGRWAGQSAAVTLRAADALKPAVRVSRPVVTVPWDKPGREYVTARFPVCVDRVMAYAEPASGDYVVFSSAHYRAVRAGRAVRLRLGFYADDEAGRWVVTSVVGFACHGGRVVQLSGGQGFTVRTP